MRKANELQQNNIMHTDHIKSNRILIENELSELQERLYLEISH